MKRHIEIIELIARELEIPSFAIMYGNIDSIIWVDLIDCIPRLVSQGLFTQEEFKAAIKMLDDRADEWKGIRGSRPYCIDCKNRICNPKLEIDCHTCPLAHDNCLSYLACEEQYLDDKEY